jgi:hypothetical protein
MSKRGLSYSRDVLEEDMSTCEQRRYGKPDDLFLPVENLLDFGDQALDQLGRRCGFGDGCDFGQNPSQSNVG